MLLRTPYEKNLVYSEKEHCIETLHLFLLLTEKDQLFNNDTHSTEKEEAFNWNRRCFQYLWGIRCVCVREKWAYLGANQKNRPIPGQTVQRGIWDVESSLIDLHLSGSS